MITTKNDEKTATKEKHKKRPEKYEYKLVPASAWQDLASRVERKCKKFGCILKNQDKKKKTRACAPSSVVNVPAKHRLQLLWPDAL